MDWIASQAKLLCRAVLYFQNCQIANDRTSSKHNQDRLSDSGQPMVPPWRIKLFGEPRAEFNGNPSGRFDYHRSILLLVRLASAPSRVWSRDEIAELLWPGEYVEVGRDRLRQTLSVLNKSLRETGGESPIVATRTNLSLSSELSSVDVTEFLELVKIANSLVSSDEKIVILSNALALVNGVFAERLTEDWVTAFRDQIAGEVHGARFNLAKALHERGDNDEALLVLQEALAERPLSEEVHFYRAVILQNQGKAAEAATLAREFAKRLQAEFNLQPGPQWRELLASSPQTDTEVQFSAPTRLSGQVLWHHMSNPLTRFFGRNPEIAWLQDAIQNKGYRLITITGPGGSGKTRIVGEFANRVGLPGVVIVGVGLAEVDHASQIPHILSGVIDLQLDSSADAYRELKDSLNDVPIWFILDNCEHLMPEIAAVVKMLLDTIPSAHILCTSRVLLNVLGERELALQPFDSPPPFACLEELAGYPSVEMLVERIQARRPDYRMTAEEAPILAELSGKLEGIPLAIELAASRGSVMTTSDMLAALDSQLDFLASKYANLPERHRAMRTALEWSFADLDPELRMLVQTMSVFVTAWTIDAAVFVSGDPSAADAVEELRSRSLIQADASGKEMRFRMLEVVRQFAQEQMSLAEKEEALGRHLKFMSHKSTTLLDSMVNRDRRAAVNAFQELLADHRLACNTALTSPSLYRDSISPLILWTVEFYEAAGLLRETSDRLKAAIDSKVLSEQDTFYAMILWGHTLTIQGSLDRVRDLVPALMEITGKPFELHLRYLLAINLAHMAWVADLKPYSEKAVGLLEAIANEIDNARQLAITYTNLGNTLSHLGRDEEAIQRYRQAIEIVENTKPDRVSGYAYVNMGRLYQRMGQLHLAIKLIQKALHVSVEVDEALGIGASIRAFVTVVIALDPELAVLPDIAKMVGFERALSRRNGSPILSFEGTGYEEGLKTLRQRQGADFEATLTQGESLKPPEIASISAEIFSNLEISQ